MFAYKEEPVASPGDVAREEAVARNVYLNGCSVAEAWDVVHRDASVIMQVGGDVSDWRLQLVHAWSDPAQVGEGSHYADGSVAAHAEIADVVEEDDGCGCVRCDGFEQQRADYDLGAAGFADYAGAEAVEVRSEAVEPLLQRAIA